MPTHYQGSEAERRALDLYIKLVRAATSLGEAAFAPLAEHDLTPTQFGVLEALHHLGPLMPSQLAQKHLKSPNNITSVLDALEKQGLVRRERNKEDRRALWIHLTDTGREKIERAFPPHLAELVRLASALSPEEQVTLAALLRKLGRQGS